MFQVTTMFIVFYLTSILVFFMGVYLKASRLRSICTHTDTYSVWFMQGMVYINLMRRRRAEFDDAIAAQTDEYTAKHKKRFGCAL